MNEQEAIKAGLHVINFGNGKFCATPAQEKKAQTDGYQPCCLCGRPIKDEAINHRLHDIGGGSGLYLHPCDEEKFRALDGEAQAGDMGFYPVGPCCLRQNPELKPFAS